MTVSSAYLSALRLAGEHGREAPHFKADSFYRALVTGDLAGDLGPNHTSTRNGDGFQFVDAQLIQDDQ